MRENRPYGSEGGAVNARPYPYLLSPLRGFGTSNLTFATGSNQMVIGNG